MDYAIFLFLLKCVTNHASDNGGLPMTRFKELWDALYKAGDVKRAFDHKRWTSIRNHLSDLGFIEWEAYEYKPTQTKTGKACKWRATEGLMDMLDGGADQPGENYCEIVRPVAIISYADALANKACDEYLIPGVELAG